MSLFKKFKEAPADAPEPVIIEETDDPGEEGVYEGDFVFHFTGKANQSYVMEDEKKNPVYEAVTNKILAIKPRPFVFRNHMSGREETKTVGMTVTHSVGFGDSLGVNISSTFKIDGRDVWDVIASYGYEFDMSLNGIACHYDVYKYGEYVGFAELGGTGLVNPKYKDSALGKIPTNGIMKVHCKRKDVPGFFLICFAVTLTELVLE